MKKIVLGISALALLSFGVAHADSNSYITDLVSGLDGKTLECASGAGDLVRVKATGGGEIEMSATFQTGGYDAGNDDGPPYCTEKLCGQEGSTDSNAENLITVSGKGDKVELDLAFGDDQQNSYTLELPSEHAGSNAIDGEFSAYGVYLTNEPDNLPGNEADKPHSKGVSLKCELK